MALEVKNKKAQNSGFRETTKPESSGSKYKTQGGFSGDRENPK